MSDERWIIVPNWDKFQHYSDRVPPWIKLYTELLHKREFKDLNAADRGVLMTVWLHFAAQRGEMLDRDLREVFPKFHVNATLKRLEQAGFITLSASKPLALRAHARALAREEEDKEKKELAPKRKTEPVEKRANAEAYEPFHEPELQPLPAEQALELIRQLTAEPSS